MTTLETTLILILYVISGSFCAYKTYNCTSTNLSKEGVLSFFAFILNPLVLIGVAIYKTFFKQW